MPRRPSADIWHVWATLSTLRSSLETDALYECPIGSLALEIRELDPPVRELLAAYFQAWTDAVLECLLEAGHRLPGTLDRLSLAEFVLTTMDGASMQARTFRDIAYFDRAVQELRNYVEILLYGRPRAFPFLFVRPSQSSARVSVEQIEGRNRRRLSVLARINFTGVPRS